MSAKQSSLQCLAAAAGSSSRLMLPAGCSDSFYKQLSFCFREVCLQPVHQLVTGSPAAHQQIPLLYLTKRGAVVPKHADGNDNNNKSDSNTNTNSDKKQQ